MATETYQPEFWADYETDLLFPPGAPLEQELRARKLSQAAFAERLGCSRALVTALIHARRELTPELAGAIAKELGTSAELWLNLESAYRQALQSRVPTSATA